MGRYVLGFAVQPGVYDGAVSVDEKPPDAAVLCSGAWRVCSAVLTGRPLLRSGAFVGSDTAAGFIRKSAAVAREQLQPVGDRCAFALRMQAPARVRSSGRLHGQAGAIMLKRNRAANRRAALRR